MHYTREGVLHKEGATRRMNLKRLAAGLCQVCGERPHRVDRKTCQECVDASKAANKVRADARRAQGLCTLCGVEPLINKTVCATCHPRQKAYSNAHDAKSRAFASANNVCVKCLVAPPEPNKRHCTECLTASKCYRFKVDVSTLRALERKCQICKQPSTTKRGLHVDHDHKTGKIRGMLCSNCNAGIGMLKEDPELFRAALIYLGHDPDDDVPEYGLSTCVH